ncbi:MAG TPA: efflux RND transporter periplasmic adaptor subunit [Verrucomicrobiae bacterium]|nr:efflux RND transporter periplasmic adaptor subunit [Verrucomicrobiae bacterium]
MKKWIVLLVVLAGGAWAFQKWNGWKPAQSGDGPARPTTAIVETRDIRFAVSAAGDIGPAEQVSVRPEINGRIETLPVDVGDRVRKDDVLFTLDDKDLQTERSSRLTEIERTKLELDRAKRNYERSQQLFTDKLISQELFEDTRTEFELAKNALERAQKELILLEDRLTKTKIVAPFDCTVLTRPVSRGQAVSGSGGFNSGTEVLTIADLNEMVVNAHINQADITRLTVGQKVEIHVESVPGLKLDGEVDRIAPQTTIKNNIKGYAARIVLKTKDARVLPGMTANVSIPVASSADALSVPLAAVFTEQGERFVLVKGGEKFERRSVAIGVYDYDYAEVLSGLTAGEVVALEQAPGETFTKLAQKPPNGGPSASGQVSTGGRPPGAGAQPTATGGPGNRQEGARPAGGQPPPRTNRPAGGT